MNEMEYNRAMHAMENWVRSMDLAQLLALIQIIQTEVKKR